LHFPCASGPRQGDLVILGFGFGVHPEYQSCAAVVTRVDASAECFGAREAKVILLSSAHVVFILLPFFGVVE